MNRIIRSVKLGTVLISAALASHAEQSAMPAPPSSASPASPTEPLAPEVVELERLDVYSNAVANQNPVATFTMPVSLLRYEPRVDVQGRGFAEAQSDISIRGGTFENTGFSIGAVALSDPQTGHYSAELPIAPAMLTSPEVHTGTDQASRGFNATAGGVFYGWQRIREGAHGCINATAGDNTLNAGELYTSFSSSKKILGGLTAGLDVSAAASQGEGARSFGDHDFSRYNGRLQLVGSTSQTDLFAGYQNKFFGWPSLYTAPSGKLKETEDIQTRLFALNHRVIFGAGGDYLQFGASNRRNNDLYDFNRLAPLAASPAPVSRVVPFQHETVVETFALDGRSTLLNAQAGELALGYRAGVVADKIDSARLGKGHPVPATPTPLGTGRFDNRTQTYAGLFPEFRHELDDNRAVRVKTGAAFDYCDRHDDGVSPLAELAYEQSKGVLENVSLGYARSTQVPTYTALNSRPNGLFAGNRDLDRSTTDNFELAVGTRADGWSFKTAAFYRIDNDLVDWTYSNALPNSRKANAVDIDTAGIELGARRSWRAFDLVLGYTWLAKSEDYGTSAVDASFYALNYARHRLTAAVVARLGAGFEVRLDNEARVQEENLLRHGSNEVVNSSLGLSWQVPEVSGLRLNALADNLWNQGFQEVPGVPAARREWSVGATYVW